MQEQPAGKHTAFLPRRRAFLPAVIAVAAVLALYLALCGYVSASGKILPRVSAAGVNLGGMTGEEAARQLNSSLADRYRGDTVALTYSVGGSDTSAQVSGSCVGADAADAAQQALDFGRSTPFPARGAALLGALITGHTVDAPLQFVQPESGASVDDVLDSVDHALNDGRRETTYTVSDTALTFTKGVSGSSVDRDAVKAKILEAFQGMTPGSSATIEVQPVIEPPTEPDLNAIRETVHTEAANAYLDKSTKKIVDAVTGVDFDVDAAKSALDATPEGGTCSVPLTLTKPQITAADLHASLFRDVLGQASSQVGGSSNRVSNVTRAARSCNEYIMNPGDVFSYNGVVGSRTAAAGYLPAPAYVGGLSVDELGGGICQVSSTIYYASLNSNLKIVERHNHSFAVGYVPDGMDATVYYGSLDFKFENDTEYPIKIVTSLSGRRLTVKIYGTKTDDITVKMTSQRLSTTPYEVVYRTDSSIPVGTRKEEVTPYTGRKVNTYRNLYDGSGKLISSTLESTNTYRKRDLIYLINPADAGKYGVGSGSSATPTPSHSSSPTPSHSSSPTPSQSPTQTPSQTPTQTPSPTVSETPAASPTAATETPPEGIPVSESPAAEGSE